MTMLSQLDAAHESSFTFFVYKYDYSWENWNKLFKDIKIDRYQKM